MDINTLEDNTLIICNNDIKIKLLKEHNNKLTNIKFMTMNEVIKKLYFDYDEKTIYYLMNKYNLKYSVALVYIKNMYYVEDINYTSAKMTKLLNYKKELIDNNLLIYDDLFKNFLKDKKIIIYEKKIDKFYKKVINELSNICKVEIIEFKYHKYPHIVYEAANIDEEVEYVAYKICELINSGIDINNIKISNIDDEYINVIKRIFSYYKIPINLENKEYIYGNQIGKLFIENYNKDIKITIDAISIYKDNPIYNKIINICNKYLFIDDYLKVKDMIIEELKSTVIPKNKYKDAIEVVNYQNIDDDTYVFIMNFNLSSIPLIYKDEDYIVDAIKPDYLDNTVEKNKLEREVTINSIDNIKNAIITYKLKSPTATYYPSSLVENYTVEKIDRNIYKSYSELADKLRLASYLDKYYKYGTKEENLNLLKYNYDIPYNEYDNSYKKIDKQELKEYLNNHLNLSYTKLDEYNNCSFKYFLSNILKLNIFEDNFAAILGTIFHHILEVGIENTIDIDEEIDKCLQKEYENRVFSKKETFFINNTKKNMRVVLDVIKRQMQNCKLDKALYEKNIPINIDKNVQVNFSGKIDKILYKENIDETILAIVDYKTGNTNIDLGYLTYGLHMQLPIYIYLASHLDFPNIRFAGIYLQKVMLGVDKISIDKKDAKEEKLKLEGYSNKDQDILELFDLSYKDSEVIKSMKVKGDGDFYKYCKVLSDNDFAKIIDIVEDEINKKTNAILNASYDINPVWEENDKDITACRYCKYIDICYRKKEDVRSIKKDKELSYLGGDINE